MTTAAATPVDDFVIDSNVAEPKADEGQTPAPASQAGAGEAIDAADEGKAIPDGKPAEGAVDDAAASDAGRVLANRKKQTAQQRIDELTWQREEEKRRADRLQQELERRSHSADTPAGSSPATDKALAPTRPEPTLEQFSDQPDPYSAWQRALGKWDREQERAQDAAQRAADEAKRAADTRAEQDRAAATAHAERERTYAAAHADYQTVIASSTAPVSRAMSAAILQSDRGPEIMYHLAQHPEVADDLARETAQSGPDSVGLVRRLLEARLDPAPSGPGSSAPQHTSASRPIRPVGSSPVVAHEGPPDDSADLDAHVQYWNRADREAKRR
jgi:hypothetical protein